MACRRPPASLPPTIGGAQACSRLVHCSSDRPGRRSRGRSPAAAVGAHAAASGPAPPRAARAGGRSSRPPSCVLDEGRSRPAEHAPRRAHAGHDRRRPLLARRLQGRSARPPPRSRHRRAARPGSRSRAVAGAAQGGRPGRCARRSSATATSSASPSAASRWAPTPCATPIASSAILRAGGLPDPLAVAAQQLLISIVIGFAIDETGEGGQPPADGAVAGLAGVYGPRLPRHAPARPLPAPRRASPSTSPPVTPTSASSCCSTSSSTGSPSASPPDTSTVAHHLGDHPVVLADLPNALEPLAFEHRHRAIVKERTGDRPAVGVLGIALDRPSAEPRDLRQSTFERGRQRRRCAGTCRRRRSR